MNAHPSTVVAALLLSMTMVACSSSSDSSPATTADGIGGGAGASGSTGAAGGSGAASAGAGGSGGSEGGSGGSGGLAGASGAAAGGAGGESGTSGTTLTGTLGALGPTKPTVSSLVISNSGETLIYMSSAPITCDLLTVSKWLKSVEVGSQVVEIVIKGPPKVGTFDSEVNYAEGGKSSSYEVNAKMGSVTFTQAEVSGVVEGTVTATYDDGSALTGSFHAEFCKGGQGY